MLLKIAAVPKSWAFRKFTAKTQFPLLFFTPAQNEIYPQKNKVKKDYSLLLPAPTQKDCFSSFFWLARLGLPPFTTPLSSFLSCCFPTEFTIGLAAAEPTADRPCDCAQESEDCITGLWGEATGMGPKTGLRTAEWKRNETEERKKRGERW